MGRASVQFNSPLPTASRVVGNKNERRKRWEKSRKWKNRNKARADTLLNGLPPGGSPERSHRRGGRKSRCRGVARALQASTKKDKFKDLRGRLEEAADAVDGVTSDSGEDNLGNGSPSKTLTAEELLAAEGSSSLDHGDEEAQPPTVAATAAAGDGSRTFSTPSSSGRSRARGTGRKPPLSATPAAEAAAAEASKFLASSLRKLDLDGFEGLVDLASDSDLSGMEDDDDEDDDDAESTSKDLKVRKRVSRAVGAVPQGPGQLLDDTTEFGDESAQSLVTPRKEKVSQDLVKTPILQTPSRHESGVSSEMGTDGTHEKDEDNGQDSEEDDSASGDSEEGSQGDGYESDYYGQTGGDAMGLGYDAGSPFTPGGGFGQRLLSEEQFRTHVVSIVFGELFPDEEDEAGDELDNFEMSGIKKCLRHILFDRNAAEPYVDIFWFVPEDKITECFVTPTALTRAIEHMYEEKGVECGATLLVLKMVYLCLPHLELQLLQVIHFSSYMYLDREKKVAQYRSPAIFDSIPPPGDPVYQRLGMVEGLVNLWAFIVERYVATRLAAREEMLAQQGGQQLVWMGADPGQILFHILLNFLKSRVLLMQYAERFKACLVLLQRAYPPAPVILLKKVLKNWPRTQGKMQVLLLQWMPTILKSVPASVITSDQYLHSKLLKRIRYSFQDGHAQVALETLRLLQDHELLLGVFAATGNAARFLSEALSACSANHWNEAIRDQSADMLDTILDYI